MKERNEYVEDEGKRLIGKENNNYNDSKRKRERLNDYTTTKTLISPTPDDATQRKKYIQYIKGRKKER